MSFSRIIKYRKFNNFRRALFRLKNLDNFVQNEIVTATSVTVGGQALPDLKILGQSKAGLTMINVAHLLLKNSKFYNNNKMDFTNDFYQSQLALTINYLRNNGIQPLLLNNLEKMLAYNKYANLYLAIFIN